MKCVLGGGNARIFAKAVQSLSKFGTDLFIEADADGFGLRSVNANKSAVGTYKFGCNFFDSYEIAGGCSDGENCCRLSMKACLGVFKNMKQVETCHVKIEPSRFKFLVQMNCRFETVKHFIISIIDDDNISADVSIDDAPNSIRGSYKIFSEIASNFQAAEEEITLEAQTDTLNVKNYIEGSRVNDKFMRSQLKLASAEFDEYHIADETSVTFCLREFRAFLLFSESLYENVSIMFSDAGSPIIFQIKKPTIFEATLIMSTLSPEDVTMCEDIQQREITESFLLRIAEKPPTKRKSTKQTPPKQKKLSNSSSTNHSINQSSDNFSSRQLERLNNNVNKSGSISAESAPDFRFDMQSIDILRNRPSARSSDELPPRVPDTSADFITVDTNRPQESESEVFVTFVETEETEDEQIQQSPGADFTGRRGLRSIFSRCFEATYVPREPSPDSQVYVPDSDDE